MDTEDKRRMNQENLGNNPQELDLSDETKLVGITRWTFEQSCRFRGLRPSTAYLYFTKWVYDWTGAEAAAMQWAMEKWNMLFSKGDYIGDLLSIDGKVAIEVTISPGAVKKKMSKIVEDAKTWGPKLEHGIPERLFVVIVGLDDARCFHITRIVEVSPDGTVISDGSAS